MALKDIEIFRELHANESYPPVSPNLKLFVQARFNATTIMNDGILVRLREAGWSEQFILGYLHGLEAVTSYLDELDVLLKEKRLEKSQEV